MPFEDGSFSFAEEVVEVCFCVVVACGSYARCGVIFWDYPSDVSWLVFVDVEVYGVLVYGLVEFDARLDADDECSCAVDACSFGDEASWPVCSDEVGVVCCCSVGEGDVDV